MTDSTRFRAGYGRSILLGALIGIGLALAFCAGFVLRDIADVPSVFASSDPTEAGYPLVDEVQTLLDDYYLRDQPEYIVRQYGAIRGLLQSLGEQNTFFIDPPVARSESDVLAGTYGGIGVNIQRSTDGDFVLYPFEDSPARREGLEDGDILRQINNTDVLPTDPQDAVDQMMRGEVRDGNGVELTVYRASTDEELTVFIAFDVINVPSVFWRVLNEDARIGYIQIQRFTNRTPDEVREAVAELRDQNIAALVLDLRGNGGGLLQEAISVASEFLDGGVVLYEVRRDSERTYDAEEGGSATDLPLVVLVNSGTASAAELLSGAIQDRERGILIGQQTYGKGTIQQIFTLSDSSSVHITSAEWLTPERNVINSVGLTPDIAMIPDEIGRDVELGEAIRYLRDRLSQRDIEA